jgi:hypothetical protein
MAQAELSPKLDSESGNSRDRRAGVGAGGGPDSEHLALDRDGSDGDRRLLEARTRARLRLPAPTSGSGTPISSVGSLISNAIFDIEDFDIECLIDIDVFNIRYRISISKVFDIE